MKHLKLTGASVRQKWRSRLPRDFQTWLDQGVCHQGFDGAVKILEKADAGPVVVLAPHPDDDVLGCGGTLYRHRLAGEAVTVIYLTDGARGDDHAGPPSKALAQKRAQEARRAGRRLGIDDLVFLDFPDGGLPVNKKTALQVLEPLKQKTPQAIFLPFLLDEHPDHQAANRLFALMAQRLDRGVRVYAYEIWTPLKPNRLVDITSVASQKEAAIKEHLSQMKHIDYAGAILGLNRFRALTPGMGKGFYEAFWVMDARGYGRLVERILGR